MGTMSATRRVQTPGLGFEVLEAGSGPLALCLHGFPDSPFTWRYLLPVLADAGFHAVAPYMRGYAPSDVPADGDFSRDALGEDAVALHEALGADERAVLIGHDWGAAAAYRASVLAPERWRRVVALGIPPPGLDARVFTDYAQLRRFFYMFVFQMPFAEDLVAAGELGFVAWLWAQWSPGYEASEDLYWVRRSLAERPNLSAALGYYRALFAGGAAGGPPTPPPQPTLYLHGEEDGCIGVELVRDAREHLVEGSRAEFIAAAGHFLHLERSDEVGSLITEWISG